MVSKRGEDQGGWSHGRPLQRCDLICDELDDEAVLFDPRLGSVHRFNAMTLFIWQRCDGAHAAHALAEAVAERYAIDTQQALLQVERVLSEFDELGLLDHSPRAPDPSPWRGPTRRAVLGVGMAKLVFVAPVISTFWAASAYANASNPIHPGSPLGGGGCKNVGEIA